MPTAAYPEFRPRPPWWGGDLQTLRNTLAALAPGRAGGMQGAAERGERLWLPMHDGSGDALAARLESPAAPAPLASAAARTPSPGASGAQIARSTDRRRPLVVLVHGLGGDETSPYLCRSAAVLRARGHPVLRLSLRGAGPSRARCRFQYNAGRTADLRDALDSLGSARPGLLAGGVVLVGYSLGGNAVLKLAGEGGAPAALRAVVSVSAPIELAEASRRFLAPRNRGYHWHMLRNLKREALAPGAELTSAERRAIASARTLFEFDDRFVAPRAGFGGAEEYYEKSSSARVLAGIAVPTLAVHALDDPWIPARAYLREREQSQARGQACIEWLLAPGGGHVGFHARDAAVPWHDVCIARFLAHAV